LPSVPRSPKPPGTRDAVEALELREAGLLLEVLGVDAPRCSTWQLLAMPAWVIDS